MLSFSLDEASNLLEEKSASTKKSLDRCRDDLDYLQEQITTMEVNIARTHNWDVQRKRDLKGLGMG